MKTNAFYSFSNNIQALCDADVQVKKTLLPMRSLQLTTTAFGLAVFLLIALTRAVNAGEDDEVIIPILKLGSQTLTNAVAVEVNPVDVLFQAEGPVFKRVKRKEMPDALKDKYPYDAAAAEKYETEKAEKVKAQREALRRESYAGLLRREKETNAQIAKKTEEIARVQRAINNWRSRPKGNGKKPVLQQLLQTKLKLNQEIDNLRDQLEAISMLLTQQR